MEPNTQPQNDGAPFPVTPEREAEAQSLPTPEPKSDLKAFYVIYMSERFACEAWKVMAYNPEVAVKLFRARYGEKYIVIMASNFAGLGNIH